jgi:phosphate/sulfate permease
MFIHDVVHVPASLSLAIVAGILALGIVASVLANRHARKTSSVHVDPPA